jgi:hypothetical protein
VTSGESTAPNLLARGHAPGKLAHLEQLSAELARNGFTSRLIGGTTITPCLKVANASVPQLNERVHIKQAGDGTWIFSWPWDKPIGPASDLTAVTAKIATVLRSVEGEGEPHEAGSPSPATGGSGQEC